MMIRYCLLTIFVMLVLTASYSQTVLAADPQTIHIDYIAQIPETRLSASSLDKIIQDRGIRGAELAINDNNTTGQFLNQQYVLNVINLSPNQNPLETIESLLKQGRQYLLLDLPEYTLARLNSIASNKPVLMFDVSGQTDQFRHDNCLPNLLHMLPSRAMRADALGQYFVGKRWTRWLLVSGQTERDQLFAAAIKRTARRFNIKIVEQRTWKHSYDARRTAQKEIPVFTQGVDYDVLIVADEDNQFGDYLPYRTWLPRPVAGTQGLIATAWHPAHEQWGALQLNNRFIKHAKRNMTEIDYGAWLAVRIIGEAASRTTSTDYKTINAFIHSDSFTMAGFKGRALSIRNWNGQLRQPVLLAWPQSIVSVLPNSKFLHPKNSLDTLGYDEPEVQCKQ
ncbi:MAG: ABC transporter substrate-binding protein [Gammaproteobacteria bacterium]|nr:ABC transporter substrate-binding protein [Gammaproteobacteria bacterium]